MRRSVGDTETDEGDETTILVVVMSSDFADDPLRFATTDPS